MKYIEPETKECKFCGKEFTTVEPNRKYCSKECLTESEKINRRMRLAGYYINDPDYGKKQYERNKEYQRQYREKHKDKYLEYQKQWHKSRPSRRKTDA